MDYQLVALSGSDKGRAWPVDERGLVLGRDETCDVVLADPIASRRHCRVYLSGEAPYFEDLGSRNPALINGQPGKDGLLHPGDDLSVGGERFVVGTVSADTRTATAIKRASATKTIPWDKGRAVALDVASLSPSEHCRPRTVQELVMLHEIARELSDASSLSELTAAIHMHLTQRFSPRALWLALLRGSKKLAFLGEALHPSQEAPPSEVLRRALDERRALLVMESQRGDDKTTHVFTMAAPLMLGGSAVGVVALQTQTPDGGFDEEDLTLLSLLAPCLAPVLCAVETVERLWRDNEALRLRAGEPCCLIGESRALRKVRSQVAKAAESDLPVLITGETGTGKELAARALHEQSDRQSGPFVIVNCAAIPGPLFESQLFGYEKGAFTGAHRASPGLLSLADGGTLLLDEIGDLSPDNQARILRAIETGSFRRVGGEDEIQVDIRVLAATNKDIAAATESGAFRRDLYHRLNAFEIHIPPLRDHRSDILLLAEFLFEANKHQAKRPLQGISPEAMDRLKSRPWPGNVRELRNCILRAIAVAQHDQILPGDLVDEALSLGVLMEGDDEFLTLPEAEKRHIASVLRRCNGNVRTAAKALGIGLSTLYKKIAKYGLK